VIVAFLLQNIFETFFQLDSNNRTRGHTAKIKKNRCRTDLRKHVFSERVVNRWNRLKQETIEAIDMNTVKRFLDIERRHGWISSWINLMGPRLI